MPLPLHDAPCALPWGPLGGPLGTLSEPSWGPVGPSRTLLAASGRPHPTRVREPGNSGVRPSASIVWEMPQYLNNLGNLGKRGPNRLPRSAASFCQTPAIPAKTYCQVLVVKQTRNAREWFRGSSMNWRRKEHAGFPLFPLVAKPLAPQDAKATKLPRMAL